jgi:hypothetical protein
MRLNILVYNIKTMTTQIINPEDIGIYLKATRKKYKISQKELANGI